MTIDWFGTEQLWAKAVQLNGRRRKYQIPSPHPRGGDEMARKMIDCGKVPNDINCTLVM